jgi:hypothetical protein
MKYVENYFVEYYESGIILLLFNTKERWLNFHRYMDNLYRIGDPQEENESYESYKERMVEISIDILEIPSGKMFIKTSMQEKDQISFYFIPFELLKETKYVNSLHPKSST